MARFFEDLAQKLLTHVQPRNRLIAIDGVDGSGKTTFAEHLASAITDREVIIVHVDDFLNPSSIRHARGRTSPLGFYLDSYDYESFARFVLDPLGPNGSGRYAARSYDFRRDARVNPEWQRASLDAVVIVEGMFLHRSELRDSWAASVFLDVPFGETARRMAARDGSNPDPEHPSMRRYVEGQRMYFERERPWDYAAYVVDNSDVRMPRIIDVAGR